MPAPRRGSSAGRAATLTIRPPRAPPGPGACRLRNAAMAAAEHKKHDSAFMRNCAMKSAAAVSPTGAMAKPPARWIEAQSGGSD